MANIIDYTYFFGDVSIAQLSNQSVKDRLKVFIDSYESEILIGLMGYKLYKAFKTTDPPVEERYTDILNGKEYTNTAGKLTKWVGLKFTTGDTKKSLIANYVYYRYIQNDNTVTTGSGEKKTDAENSVESSPKYKLVKAWNQMIDWCREFVEFMESNKVTYPEWDLYDNCEREFYLTKATPYY